MKKLLLPIMFSLCLCISSVASAQPSNSPFGPMPPDNTPYDSTTWDGSFSAPTQNAIRDQIEAMIAAPVFSGDILPDADNTYDIGENTTPLRFRNGYFSGTVTAPIFTGGEAATQSGSFTVHHGGIVTWWDSGNDTSVVFGPVTDGTTTLGITGSISVSGDVSGGSLTITPTDNAAIFYDPSTAGYSEWLTGPNHTTGATGPFEIRQSAMPGTNVRWQVDTDGVETSYGWNVTDGTDTTTFAMKTEAGESNAELVIGLDESRRTMVVCDAGDVDADFGLSASSYPSLVFVDNDCSHNTTLSQNGNMFTITTGNGANPDILFSSKRRIISQLAGNISSADFVYISSYSDNSLTDTDGEQSWLYVEPKINQSSTAGYNALKIKVTETGLGDASAATDSLTNNLILAGTSVDPDMFKVDNSGRLKVGDVQTALHTITVTLTAAEVNALRATPQTIVAAQGANTWIELVSAVITYDYATAAFTVGGDEDLVIEWADGTDATASIETTGFLDQTDDEIRFYPAVLAAGADPEASINQALQVSNSGTGEIADGGTSEVDIQVVYRVYATGF